MSDDQTKELLEQLLAQLYEQQTTGIGPEGESYLRGSDGQFLGNITSNQYDQNSILNQYGPYGSQYSNTSIFNQYSPYGSPYGTNSINNPYCTTPPILYLRGKEIGPISANPYVPNRISNEAFLYSLKNDLSGLLQGNFVASKAEALQKSAKSYIEAGDGTFLGKLNPNRFDQDSIFNKFGAYGNKFSQSSIFNKFSTYGNQFNQLSPYNKFSNNPPKIYVNGKFVAYLTKNRFKKPSIDPDELCDWAGKNVRKYG